ncbi:MAG TPA: tetratricopeptide repeat protein [Azospirillum sp.]|nr:tetratricopeptide repeat protein [Azospirillum sp.]
MTRNAPVGRGAVVAAVLLLAMAAPAAADPAGRSKQLTAAARESLEAGDLEGAVRQLQTALVRDHGNLAARRLLGEVQHRRGYYESAEKELRRVLAATGDTAVALALGDVLLHLGRPREVFAVVAAHQATPDGGRAARVLHGRAEMALERPDAASAAFESVLAEAPGDPEASYWAARLDADLGRLDAAERRLAALPARGARVTEILVLLAEIARREARLDTAAAHLAEAEAGSPNDLRVLLEWARLHVQAGRPVEADAAVTAVLAVVPDHLDAKLLRCWAALLRGDAAAADDVFLGVQDRARAVADAHLLKAAIKMRLGRYAQAEDALTRFGRARPGHRLGRLLLAALRLRLGQAGEALGALSGEEPGGLLAASLRAEALLRLDRADEAAALLRRVTWADVEAADTMAGAALETRAVLDTIGAPEPAWDIARIHAALGAARLDAAAEAYARVQARHPGHPLAVGTDAALRLAQGDEPGARALLADAFRAQPDSTVLLEALEAIDRRRGDTRAVAAHLRAHVAAVPASVPATLRLSRLLSGDGRTEEALAVLGAGLGAVPRSIPLWRERIALYRALGRRADLAEAAGTLRLLALDEPDLLREAATAYAEAGEAGHAADMARAHQRARASRER